MRLLLLFFLNISDRANVSPVSMFSRVFFVYKWVGFLPSPSLLQIVSFLRFLSLMILCTDIIWRYQVCPACKVVFMQLHRLIWPDQAANKLVGTKHLGRNG